MSPTLRVTERRPSVRFGIVDRSLIGKYKVEEVVFATDNHEPSVRQYGGGEIKGRVSRWQAGDLRPGSFDVAPEFVRGELPPIRLAVTLKDRSTISQQKPYSRAIRRRVHEVLQGLRSAQAGDSNHQYEYRKQRFLLQHGFPFVESYYLL